MQGMGRRARIYKEIDDVFSEDWPSADEVASYFAAAEEAEESGLRC
jgi:hypothetical protein